MAQEILSAKLDELDRKLSRLHSRIQMGESANPDEIQAELAALREECGEEERSLCDKLRFSRAGMVAGLSQAYGEIRQIIQNARDQIEREDAGDEELTVEEKILLAEYVLDFAVQAADHALLISMEALSAQMIRQEQEEKRL